MTDAQKLQLQLSELRTKINGFADDGDTAELDTMTTEYGKLESRYRAALITETADEKPSGNDQTPEGRDLQRPLLFTTARGYIITRNYTDTLGGNNAEDSDSPNDTGPASYP